MKAFAKKILASLRPHPAPTTHPNTEIDSAPFSHFSMPIRGRMQRVAATRFFSAEEHTDAETKIPGWLSAMERQLLYALGLHMPGPIAEFGSWCGLSTTATARGIKDSGEEKPFQTYDLILTEDMFRPLPDGRGIGMFMPGEEVASGVCPQESYENEIRPYISLPGGSNAVLKQSLGRLGLLDKVEIFCGDFRTFQPTPCGGVSATACTTRTRLNRTQLRWSHG